MRPLNLGLVYEVAKRVRGVDDAAVRAADWVEALLDAEFYRGASFHSISLVIVYAMDTELDAEVGRPRKGALPVTMRLSIEDLRRIAPSDLERAFRYAILKTVAVIAQRYSRPAARVHAAIAELGTPPLPGPASDGE